MAEHISRADVESEVVAARQYIAGAWGWFMGLGIFLLLAGMAAIAFPLVSSIATTIALGWIFLFAGFVTIIHAFSTRQWGGFIWSVLIGVLYLFIGGWLAFFPLGEPIPVATGAQPPVAPTGGVLTLTIVVAALFLAEGALEVIMAFRVRPHEGWGWLLMSGLVAIAVGALIGLGLPSSAAWALGLLAGVNLISTGVGFILVASMARRVAQA
jgi:uncharacterized membrane protein HdeD (DUF308 family)